MQDTSQQTSSFIVDGCMIIINNQTKEQCGKPITKSYSCLIGLPDGSEDWYDIKVCNHHARHFRDNNV